MGTENFEKEDKKLTLDGVKEMLTSANEELVDYYKGKRKKGVPCENEKLVVLDKETIEYLISLPENTGGNLLWGLTNLSKRIIENEIIRNDNIKSIKTKDLPGWERGISLINKELEKTPGNRCSDRAMEMSDWYSKEIREKFKELFQSYINHTDYRICLENKKIETKEATGKISQKVIVKKNISNWSPENGLAYNMLPEDYRLMVDDFVVHNPIPENLLVSVLTHTSLFPKNYLEKLDLSWMKFNPGYEVVIESKNDFRELISRYVMFSHKEFDGKVESFVDVPYLKIKE